MAYIKKGMIRPEIDDEFFKNLNYYAPKAIISSANDLIKKLSIKSFPVNLHRVLQDLNISYREEILDDDISGILREKYGHTIIINKLQSPARKNFAIAHEIGHYCLHKNIQSEFIDEVFFRGGDIDSTEYEANKFAHELLMPRDEFLGQIKLGNDSIEDLSNNFEVSTLAIRVRAKMLNLNGHGL